MRLFVRFDKTGKMISTMKVNVMDESLEHPFGFLEEAESVLEVKAPARFKSLQCHEICEQYLVDVKKKKLKKKKQN